MAPVPLAVPRAKPARMARALPPVPRAEAPVVETMSVVRVPAAKEPAVALARSASAMARARRPALPRGFLAAGPVGKEPVW